MGDRGPCFGGNDRGDAALRTESQAMPGDIVRSTLRAERQFGWVCCVTPESDEGHVYWQPVGDNPPVDTREPLKSLRCVDRALIPGDIVRRCDAATGEKSDSGGRDRDAMGMVVGTEVTLELLEIAEGLHSAEARRGGKLMTGVAASSLRHLVPIRLATWVVHRGDGWLGRVQCWDEDIVIRYCRPSGSGMVEPCRCRIRAANQKQGITIMESFYRDFFPGLLVSMSVQDLKSSEFEWLAGDAAAVISGFGLECSADNQAGAQRVEAVIEEVSVGAARVEWLAQVPLWRGWSTERPPRADGCQEDKLLFLLGEAECSSRWALGDRARYDGKLVEVCGVETFLDVRWQDDALSVRVPARELQLCNPDAFSFFPSELVCQRSLEEATGSPAAGTPFRGNSGVAIAHGGAGVGAAAANGSGPSLSALSANTRGDPASNPMERCARGGVSNGGEDQPPPRVGFVVRADPASRMVSVRWLDEGGPSDEEEWSAFDLQIDPEFGYRLGDAVIRCRDWEQQSGRESASGGPRVGQAVALESGSVRVRWLDSTVSLHGPRELYRVGDEDEGSVSESQATGEGGAAGDADAVAAVGDTVSVALTMDDDGEAAENQPDCAEEDPPQVPSKRLRLDNDGVGDGNAADAAGANATEEEVANSVGIAPGGATDTGGGPNGGPGSDREASSMDVAVASYSCPPDAGGGTMVAPVAQDLSTSVAVPANAMHGDVGGASGAVGAAGNGERTELSFEDMAWEALPTDHHFLHCTQSNGPTNRQFMRRVQREWAILQRGLPRGVWVHVYPERMELMRACLVGPEGTPYADALFFFDVHLAPTYPQCPPQVRFWSFGENLNPNLYENGKVCLSLLGTWSGKDSETWSPERSNLLQVLVSILGLVLNTEPYYNEPGFERERDTPQGGLRSQRYNESVALSNYHLMLRVLRSPPCDFQRVVRRHFAERRTAILERARRLREGLEADCSEGFKKSLAALLPRLEEALPEAASP